jgi:hypothetical protein
MALWLAGCASGPSGPRVSLDPRTGATFTMVDTPMIFARERRDVAANARDYLTVVAVEINVSGQRHLYLAVHRWSTIDLRSGETSPEPSVLLLVADGRDITLTSRQDQGASLPIDATRLMRPEDADVVTTLYPIDGATLEYIAGSHSLSAVYSDSFALPFALWRDGRTDLRRMLARVSSEESP